MDNQRTYTITVPHEGKGKIKVHLLYQSSDEDKEYFFELTPKIQLATVSQPIIQPATALAIVSSMFYKPLDEIPPQLLNIRLAYDHELEAAHKLVGGCSACKTNEIRAKYTAQAMPIIDSLIQNK